MGLKIMRKSFYVNAMLVIVKLVTGTWFRSTALIADGIHSLSDLISDVFVLFGLKQSEKPPDKEHPYGHGKLEYVVSLFIGVSILFIAYQLISRVATTFNDPVTIPSIASVYVVLFVIVSKSLLSRYLDRRGRAIGSSAVMASAKESFADVVSSGVVLAGIAFALIGDAANIVWMTYADKAAGILIGVFIIRIAITVIIDAVRSLLGKNAPESLRTALREAVETFEDVIAVDRLVMITYGHYYQVMIEIRVDGDISVKDGHDIATRVKTKMQEREDVAHVIVHVNPKE